MYPIKCNGVVRALKNHEEKPVVWYSTSVFIPCSCLLQVYSHPSPHPPHCTVHWLIQEIIRIGWSLRHSRKKELQARREKGGMWVRTTETGGGREINQEEMTLQQIKWHSAQSQLLLTELFGGGKAVEVWTIHENERIWWHREKREREREKEKERVGRCL